MAERIRPIYANAFFRMSITGLVTQYMLYYYDDPEKYYYNLDKSKLRRELINIKRNLQSFLEEEQIYINNRRTKAKVRRIDIGFIRDDIPVIEFIITFRGKLAKGRNVYIDKYEEEVSEYPYEFTWYLPGEVVEYQLDGEVKVSKGLINVKVKKGTKLRGEEKIVFTLH
ncbi:MAG: hypothetical protein OWQ54_04485 [Sulfolobaceae archaeon]|nr:hypothetical protein [Sulfolobaceae archaeon]